MACWAGLLQRAVLHRTGAFGLASSSLPARLLVFARIFASARPNQLVPVWCLLSPPPRACPKLRLVGGR